MYEATKIVHRTLQVLAVTMVFGTCGVFEIYFWRKTPSALPTKFSMRRRCELWIRGTHSRNVFLGALVG
jgi:hypothetical protein